MRARFALAVTVVVLIGAFASPVAAAAPRSLALAQTDDQEGQGETAPETGAGKSETEAGASETGPPWTYQMARLSIVLLVLLVLAVGLLYYRLVEKRRRGAY
jgi:hypothetical protein